MGEKETGNDENSSYIKVKVTKEPGIPKPVAPFFVEGELFTLVKHDYGWKVFEGNQFDRNHTVCSKVYLVRVIDEKDV